ncbi:hypothetical protein BAE44_0010609, partial [Dichanthelium oligosanthes]
LQYSISIPTRNMFGKNEGRQSTEQHLVHVTHDATDDRCCGFLDSKLATHAK